MLLAGILLAGGWQAARVGRHAGRAGVGIGATPGQWTTLHRTRNNDDVYEDSGAPERGPTYAVRLPMLASSDSPVVGGRLLINVSASGRNPSGIYPGELLAIDPTSGRVLWRHRFPNSVDSEPIVADGRVIDGVGNAVFPSRLVFPFPAVHNGMMRGTGPSAIEAISERTGRMLWKVRTRGSDQPTPTVIGHTVYAVTGSRQLLNINLLTGRVRWRINLGMYVSRSSPRVVGSLLLVGGGGPEQVEAINLRTRRIVWRRRILHAIGGVDDATLAYADGRVVGEAMEGSPDWPLVSPDHYEILFAINAANGQLLWTRRLATGYEPRYKQAATPMVQNGVVYAGNAINGAVTAVRLTTGQRLWQVNFPDPVTRPLAFFDHRLVGITSHGRIFSLKPNGTGVTSTRLGPFVNAFGPVVINRTLLVAGNTPYRGYLRAVSWRTVIPLVRPAGIGGA